MKRTFAVTLAGALFSAAAVYAATASYWSEKPLRDAELDQLRGGLSVSTSRGQIDLSIGIERAVIINGELVAVTQLLMPRMNDLFIGKPPGAVTASTTIGAKNKASLATPGNTGFAPLVVIQNGPENHVVLPSQLNGVIATAIQNSLNNQRIQTSTILTVTTNTLQLMRSSAQQAAIAQAMANSVR
ncbi:MAG: hypothetical protein ACREBC_34310 [Pyrinomonadaceae bacterium]